MEVQTVCVCVCVCVCVEGTSVNKSGVTRGKVDGGFTCEALCFLCRKSHFARLTLEQRSSMIRSAQPLPRCPHGDMPWGVSLDLHI